jgi:hypothetical protein
MPFNNPPQGPLADVSWTIHAGIQHPHPPANHFCKENVWTTGAARGARYRGTVPSGLNGILRLAFIPPRP